MSLRFQLSATGLLADKLKKDLRRERGKVKYGNDMFPYCCHFQKTSVGTIFNLSFTAIKAQIDHQILIK